MRYVGQDKLGTFETEHGTRRSCGCCGMTVRAWLEYLDLSFEKDEISGLSLLWRALGGDGTIGITCGCYAKVQRQLVRVLDTRRPR